MGTRNEIPVDPWRQSPRPAWVDNKLNDSPRGTPEWERAIDERNRPRRGVPKKSPPPRNAQYYDDLMRRGTPSVNQGGGGIKPRPRPKWADKIPRPNQGNLLNQTPSIRNGLPSSFPPRKGKDLPKRIAAGAGAAAFGAGAVGSFAEGLSEIFGHSGYPTTLNDVDPTEILELYGESTARDIFGDSSPSDSSGNNPDDSSGNNPDDSSGNNPDDSSESTPENPQDSNNNGIPDHLENNSIGLGLYYVTYRSKGHRENDQWGSIKTVVRRGAFTGVGISEDGQAYGLKSTQGTWSGDSVVVLGFGSSVPTFNRDDWGTIDIINIEPVDSNTPDSNTPDSNTPDSNTPREPLPRVPIPQPQRAPLGGSRSPEGLIPKGEIPPFWNPKRPSLLPRIGTNPSLLPLPGIDPIENPELVPRKDIPPELDIELPLGAPRIPKLFPPSKRDPTRATNGREPGLKTIPPRSGGDISPRGAGTGNGVGGGDAPPRKPIKKCNCSGLEEGEEPMVVKFVPINVTDPDTGLPTVVHVPSGEGGSSAAATQLLFRGLRGQNVQRTAVQGQVTANNFMLVTGQGSILGTINTKVNQMQSFLTDKFEKLWKASGMDRLLNLLILASVIHNAAMLSGQFLVTLADTAERILQAVGIYDPGEQEYSVSELLGRQLDNFLSGIFGAENVDYVQEQWVKANRIISTASNLLGAIQSMHNAAIEGIQTVAGWVAKFANGTKREGNASDTAWPWMNPNPNFKNKILSKLERLDDLDEAASQINQVASSVVEIQETRREIIEYKEELNNQLENFVTEESDRDADAEAAATPPDIEPEDLWEAR